MKLYPTLHATAELLTGQSSDECSAAMQMLLGVRFNGSEAQEGWTLSHIDRNLFRPALHLRFVPDEDGTILAADYKPDAMLLTFMFVWSLVVAGIAAARGWLLLVMLPVFWAVMIVGFSKGVSQATAALAEEFEASEVV